MNKSSYTRTLYNPKGKYNSRDHTRVLFFKSKCVGGDDLLHIFLLRDLICNEQLVGRCEASSCNLWSTLNVEENEILSIYNEIIGSGLLMA